MRYRRGYLAEVHRDADQAYLQARIDGPGRVPTLFELPRDWWPDSWFNDGAKRQDPRYVRHLVLLRSALYGHPEAGFLWDDKFTGILVVLGWRTIDAWCGVFVHTDGSIIILYVDDVMLAASMENAYKHSRLIEQKVDFKEEAKPLLRYLGAQYRCEEYNPQLPRSVRRLSVSIAD